MKLPLLSGLARWLIEIEARRTHSNGDDNLDWLAMRVAMLGVDFDVHEPPELVEHLLALGRRLARAASVE